MHSFASCEMPAKYSSGKQKSRFVMFEHVSSGDSSRNGDTPLRSTYNTTPTLLKSENTPTVTEYRHPTQEHRYHCYAPTIRKHSYSYRIQTPHSGAQIPLLCSHNQKTLLQLQNTDTPLRSTDTTAMLPQSENTPTVTEYRHPTQEHRHHCYAPTIRKHYYGHRTQTPHSGVCTTPLLRSYNQKTLTQSQNTDNSLRGTYNTTPTLLSSENTPTVTEHRQPTQEHVQHHSYTPVIRKHS